MLFVIFFFQAEDGIRDDLVTEFRRVLFRSVIGDDDTGPCVSTIEHVMATLCGLGVHNAIIEIDGAEAPIMDGSAAAFVEAIDQAGIVALSEPRRYTKVLKTIRVEKGDAFRQLTPYDAGFHVAG